MCLLFLLHGYTHRAFSPVGRTRYLYRKGCAKVATKDINT